MAAEAALPSSYSPTYGTPAAAAAAAFAADAAAINECLRTNNRLCRAGSAEELFSVLAQDWRSVDAINLCSALHRLAQLGEGRPGGPPALAAALRGDPRWAWLLDQLRQAAASPSFGAQCTANALAALCKLDALSPTLLGALQPPLERALRATLSRADSGAAAADLSPGGGFGAVGSFATPGGTPGKAALTPRGLTQVLWCIGKDVQSLKGLALAVKEVLLEALWVLAPELDAQGVATAWWALGELSWRCLPWELGLQLEAPDLLPRLAIAARMASGGLSFQGLGQVLHACVQMKPQPYRDEALLDTLTTAAARRLQAGQEPPPPKSVGLIALALGRLGFLPRQLGWCSEREQRCGLLDGLGQALVGSLHQAEPQDVCNFLVGLGQLRAAPRAPVLRALLTHLGAEEVPRPAAAPGAAAAARQPSGDLSAAASASAGGALAAAAPPRPAGAASGAAGTRSQLVLERYSSQELADLVHALRRILTGRGGGGAAGGGGSTPPGYSEQELPSAVVEAFFDALDTVLRVRASISTRLSPRASCQLAMTGQHVGTILAALGRLAAIWPCAGLTDATLVELEAHVSANHYTPASLASFLRYFALTGVQPAPAAAEAVCERALVALRAPQEPCDQPPFTLCALAQVLAALAALRLRHPRLLCALLPAVGAALGQQEQAPGPCEAAPLSPLPELVSVTAALGHLAAAGLLADAGLGAPQLAPLWQQVMCHLAAAAAGAQGGLPPQDAGLVQQAAAQLGSLPGGRPGSFWLPPAVQRALVAAWRR